MYYFGYTKVGDDNPTGFFEFESHSEANLAQFNKFKADNERALNTVTQEGYRPEQVYRSGTGECKPMFSEEDLTNIITPSITHAKNNLTYAENAKKN